MVSNFSDQGHPGDTGDLAVVVRKFHPKVMCSEQPYPRDSTVLEACEAIVDQMEVSKQERIFTQQNIHDPNLETPLPAWYHAPAQGSRYAPPLKVQSTNTLTAESKAPKCLLKVTGSLPRQFANWFRLWEAASAIHAMCIRQGKGGYWVGLGKSEMIARKLEES